MPANRFIYILLCFASIYISCSKMDSGKSGTKTLASENWSIFRGNSALTGSVSESIPEKFKLIWRFQTGDDIKSSPVIFEGTVYIGSGDGKLYALRLSDGEEIWNFDTGDVIEAPPLYIGNSIYIGALDGTFYAINPKDGSLQWSKETDAQISGSANYLTSSTDQTFKVLVGSYDNRIYCFDASTGKIVWNYETDNYINGAPATDGKIIVFGGCDSKLHILNAELGTKIGDVETGSYIAGSAALFDDHAYLGHYGSQLISIDINEKNIQWTYEAAESAKPFFSSPAVNQDYVIIGSRDNDVHCVDRKSGELIWRFRTRDEVDSSPVICGGKVITASLDGWLYILDIKSGSLLWSYEIGGSITSCPAVSNKKIVIGSDDGNVYAFGEES